MVIRLAALFACLLAHFSGCSIQAATRALHPALGGGGGGGGMTAGLTAARGVLAVRGTTLQRLGLWRQLAILA